VAYWKMTQLMRKWDSAAKEVWHVQSIDEVIKCIHEFEKVRPKLPYMTDGW